MNQEQLILFGLIVCAVSLWISYVIIKMAIENAIVKSNLISNMLLVEIALKHGVAQEKIDEILNQFNEAVDNTTSNQ